MDRIIFPNTLEPVSEQDFIMLLRRLYRDANAYLVLRLAISELPAVGREHRQLEILQQKIEAMSKKQDATFHTMTNGDVFLVQSMPAGAVAADLAARLLVALQIPELQPPSLKSEHMNVYAMPGDYSLLRARINSYIDLVRASVAKSELTAEQMLQTEGVQGPLTVWSLAQVERLFEEIDMEPYIRQQPVYRVANGSVYSILYHDFYMSLSDLQRTRFPKLDMREPARLIMELRHSVDSYTLREFLRRYDAMQGQPVFLNLSLDTATASPFSQFCHIVHNRQDRAIIGFEIHSSDWLLDFTLTQNIVGLLREEGFKTGLDAVTPAMLPFVNLNLLPTDQIKIFVDSGNIAGLQKPDVLRAIKNLPPERIVFARCDTEAAWQIGRTLGITRFHGWYLDDMVKAEHPELTPTV